MFTLHTITIIGQIEGHYALSEGQKATSYEHILPQLAEIESSIEPGGLLLLLNTAGGDVEAGLAIAEMIAGMTKPTVSLILGGSHSIGVPLAVAAKRCLIAPSANMALHPVRYNGLVVGAPQTYAWFRRMQQRIVSFVTAHSRIPAEELQSLMMRPDELATDIGSVLSSEQAVSSGLVDAVGGLSDAISYLRSFEEKPESAPQTDPGSPKVSESPR